MKFTEIEYKRPDFEAIKQQFQELLDQLPSALELEQQIELIDAINGLRNHFGSMRSFVFVKHSINTSDAFFEGENTFFDQYSPQFTALENEFYKWLNELKDKSDLEKEYGKYFFEKVEVALATFSPEIIEDLQEENRLRSSYKKLIAGAKIPFKGEEYNLSSIGPHNLNPDRAHRKEAVEAMYKWLQGKEQELDEIYDELVKLRHKMAVKLGFENFVELGYKRMGRTDYNAKDVKKYRENIQKYVVPFVAELRESQRKRLGLDTLEYYDLGLKYLDGNATPKGSPEWILDEGKKMYKELSPETDEFFSYMTDNAALDLVSKPNKMAGGYCTFLPKWKLPFIFSNFNGTSHDIDVLTHEAGHAFQVYNSREFKLPEYHWCTSEAAEIHSMSMEFLTWPWMENFFKEDTAKYKFNHVTGGLSFLPYGASVDEFQHVVYENPDWTPEERNRAWTEIENKYNINVDLSENEYLSSGRFWQKQGHIYTTPFYYIDYTLAQACAYQFWMKSEDDFKNTWENYVELCKLGGSKPFLELVASAQLESPFNDNVLKDITEKIDHYTLKECSEFRV